MAIKKFYDVKKGDKLIHKASLLIAASDAVDIGEGVWCVAIQQPAYCDNLESEPDCDIEIHEPGELDRLRAQVAELVAAGQLALNIIWVENLVAKEEGNIRYEATTKAVYDQLKAAIAAAEGGKDDD